MISAAPAPSRNIVPHRTPPPKRARISIPPQGPTVKARPMIICERPMYSPRRLGGAMSVRYAAMPGKKNISPTVQMTTVAATDQMSQASASPPKPTPKRSAPSASVRRCGQCAVAMFNGTSQTTMSRQFKVKRSP
jgi:hypothetical protein